MPGQQFDYLPLLRTYKGRARLGGGGSTSPQTVANRNVRQAHSATLDAAALAFSANWKASKSLRQATDSTLPEVPAGVPLLLEVDPSLDLDALRHYFDFEIVAEQEDGFVIVASEDIDMATFRDKVRGFAVEIRGSATIAEVHRLHTNDADRLARILSDHLLGIWGQIGDDDPYIVDIGIACTGTMAIPKRPKRGKRTKDAEWAEQEFKWSEQRAAAYREWEDLQIERETALGRFVTFYQGEILHLVDGADFEAGVLPDSFTARIRISGKGLKDIVLNYPYVFEVVEPEDIALPQNAGQAAAQPQLEVAPVTPGADAPAVCVIDSGIQEQHLLLQPAVDQASSHCFLPDRTPTDVGDEVAGGGHGTRVAGAVLYGEEVAKAGTPQLPYWIQNARVLDANNRLPETVFPAEAMRTIVEHYHFGPRATRIFNHSINAYGACRLRYMSSWAAEIDALADAHDVLVIQSGGNLVPTGPLPYPGVQDHLAAGRAYPEYFSERAVRVANPGQSLQALTVGSVAYDAFEQGAWRSFATGPAWPSAFSRSGPGIWDVIKPEVVEYGGDFIRTANQPPDVQGGGGIPAACPELVRSTLATPGPAVDRDATGTSFAAPKVARIAAELQRVLPDATTLLYRALIVQSAQWPEWAEGVLTQIRTPPPGQTRPQRQQLLGQASNIIRSIGFGIPELTRATTNTDHRTTYITQAETPIHAYECHIYQVPIPEELRRPGDDFDIRIDVTLSYVAQPRRTRRNLRRYLSTWVDWISSNLGEGLNSFHDRAIRGEDGEAGEEAAAAAAPLPGAPLPWTLHVSDTAGAIRGTRRNSGTVQKDWALVKSNALPGHFCIAVRGHEGWSNDPDTTARYALAVTFEIVGQEISIHDPLRTAVLELQSQIETEVEVEARAEIEVEGEA
jgi:hypothetical protein